MGSSPMFPIMQTNPYIYLVNHVNLLNTQKLLQTKIRVNKKILSLIRALNLIGCIHKFQLVKGGSRQYVYITVPFYKNTPFFKSVRVISTPSKKHSISFDALKLITKTLNASILLLSTNHGIINHLEALDKKVGGIALCIVH